MADDFDKPNGIAFSPDEKTLYVADTGGSHDPDGAHHIRAFDVIGGKQAGQGSRLRRDRPRPRRRLPARHRRQCLDLRRRRRACLSRAQGELLGKILVPEVVSNVCFGGPKRNRLFITATSSLYAVYVGAAGALKP